MDERKIKAVIKESFQQFLKPMEDNMTKKIQGLEDAMQFMSDSFEEQKTRFESVLEELKILKHENQEMKKRLQIIESKLDDIEVREKENNIIVAGVPKQVNKSPIQIMNKILRAMEVMIEERDIKECFRMKNQDDGPILVKFSNVQLKKDVLKRIKQLKGITLNKCKLEGTERKIYLNEDLPLNKRLLFKKGYKAADCTNGIIYLKKTEKDVPIRIRGENDLP
ncbi:uncharacterized protein [Diabrotica undecimpunctata]|uniref:uncharacterized protein n=1 Tax=Diabrotica undecimpunctata TaxID=50387 RepID=UPI003B63D4B6